MLSLFFLAGLSFLICLFLTPLVRNSLNRAEILDRPDERRKFHEHPIPRLGGVPIMASMALSLAIFSQVPFPGADLFRNQWPLLLRLLPAAVLVFLVGVADDLFSLRPWQKLAAEAVAASWLYSMGIRIHHLFGSTIADPHWISYPLTLLWLVGCANALDRKSVV